MHTLEDIQKDIFNVEGIVVDVQEFSPSSKFIMKYSEVFDEQVSSDATNDDLEDKIKHYLLVDQTVKDRLLEKLMVDIKTDNRHKKMTMIMRRHIVTSVITASLILAGYSLIHFI
jgi:hypothetical protein